MTKKKSIWAFVLALCLIVPAMFMMTACGHKHTAVTEWSSDATYHWHVCEDEKCQEQLDKAEHTWDAGVITKEATFLEDGEKTYTCSVCKRTKTEAVAYNYVDLNYVEDKDTQTYIKFTVTEAGTYYFRYEVKNCGFANGYYWINMKKVGGGIKSFGVHCGYFCTNVSRMIKRKHAMKKRQKAEEERRERARQRAERQRAQRREMENGGLVQVHSRSESRTAQN